MRVLIATGASGGVFVHAFELARALRMLSIDVALATKGAPLAPDQRRAIAAIPGLELFESAYKLEWMEEPWEDIERAGRWLADVAARVRPDVVHLNDFAHGALDLGAPKVVVGHSCVLSWFEAVRGRPAPPSWERYRVEVSRGLRGADAVVAPTRAMLASLRRHYGPLRDARAIPHGRDPELFLPAVKEPLVFTAGRVWDAGKNVAAVEAVAARLPWPCRIAGDPAPPDGTSELASSSIRLGRIPPSAVASWLARASIYALPARYEPFGLSVLEAALARCALVLGDIASLRETWEGAALFVPPDDHGALQFALLDLIEHRGKRFALAIEAEERARDLGPARMARAYLDLYSQLLVRCARGGGGLACAS